jgi:hypothetical protein
VIIERVVEYQIDPDDVAAKYYDDYQEFIQKNDNEDSWDFVVYLVERYGLDDLLDFMGEEYVEKSVVTERFF